MPAPTRRPLLRLLPLAAALLLAACVPVRHPAAPRPATPLNPNWHPAATNAPAATAPKHQPPPPPATAPKPDAPPITTAQLYALQIRLDRAGFSTGGIDGKWGRKTQKALDAWLLARDLPPYVPGERPPSELLLPDGLWTTYAVTAADHAALTPWPDGWLARSRQDALGYVTVQEAVAERFHLYENALRSLNPNAAWPNPPAGTVLRVPDVPSAVRIRTPLERLDISLSQKTVRAYRNGKLVAQFPCSIAADRAKRPAGQTLAVGPCADRPEYTFDPDMYANDPNAAGIATRLRIPPGPNNPVGLAWIGLSPLPGYGIHGTPAPEKISHTESHGCFRLTNWDAIALLRAVHTGLPVHILP